MYKLSIQTHISAAHRLKEYEGACARIHGHNWKIEITVGSEKLDTVGMVIDFKDLSDLTWQVVGKFDHQVINDVPPFDKMNPTAENLSRFIYRELAKALPRHVKMHSVRLWETEKYFIEYSE